MKKIIKGHIDEKRKVYVVDSVENIEIKKKKKKVKPTNNQYKN